MPVLPILLLSVPAFAPAFVLPPVPDTPAGPSQVLARRAANAAVIACEQLGFRTMATVVDAGGRPVAAMAAGPDVTSALAPESVRSAQDAAYFDERSSAVARDFMEQPSVFYAIHDHPQLAPPLPGGVPLATGAIGVAGAPDGDTDEQCAQAGAAYMEPKLK